MVNPLYCIVFCLVRMKMANASFFPFHPEKLLRQGGLVVGMGVLIVAGGLIVLGESPAASFGLLENHEASERENVVPLSFSLNLEDPVFALPMPHIEKEIIFSFDPPRPDTEMSSLPLVIRLPKARQEQRVALPSRVNFSYVNGLLTFSGEESLFWVELEQVQGMQIEGKIHVDSQERRFVSVVQEGPLRQSQEFAEGSPFRTLAEARWWGNDLCQEKYGNKPGGERIEIGPLTNAELVELDAGDWLVWKEERWQKKRSLEDCKVLPIARVEEKAGRALVVGGWDQTGHIRCALSPFQPAPLRVKAEELFSAVRVRSEKQISCMLEKQCLILKVGDWVVKNGSRWKILRKKEEKEAFLNGKWFGELFVFDRIEMKGNGKTVQGQLFNAARSQVVPIEVSAGAPKPLMSARKGKNK